MTAESLAVTSSPKKNYTSAVLSMALCVAMLIAAEFMPVSLLTPMAEGLSATEGQTGQAISISGLFAVITSLVITTVAGRLNRKWVLIAMTSFMLLSLVLVATASNFLMLMIARSLLGISVGGFWALATAVIMRLVPEDRVGSALGIMYSGQAAAAAFAAPIGSYLGGIIGWRGVFWVLVPLVVGNLIWQCVTLPSMPTKQVQSFRSLLEVMSRRYFAQGILAVLFAWSGAFAMFTYLRPYLETVVEADVTLLSQLLLLLGCAGFIGTWVGGKLATNHVMKMLQVLPVVMGCIAIGLIQFGQNLLVVGVLLALWGAMNTAMSLSWMAWVSQNVEDAPEAAGSLIVAAIQTAILLGAALGGVVLDYVDIEATFLGSAILSVVSVLIIGSGQSLLKPATT